MLFTLKTSALILGAVVAFVILADVSNVNAAPNSPEEIAKWV